MIRAATHADVDRLVELGEAMHAKSSYADVTYNRDKVTALLARLIDGGGVVFAHVQDGVVMGGIAGGVSDYWFSDEKIGFDFSLLIDPDNANGIAALRLITALKTWCKGQGARKLKMGITTGLNVERMTKLYLMAGAVHSGNLFEMEL